MKNVLELKEGKGLLKISDNNGNFLLEAVYLNGQKSGKVKEYYDNDKLKYYGSYLNGKKHGKGREFWQNKLVFEGYYLNGKIWNGKGYNKSGFIGFEIKNGNGKVYEYSVYNRSFLTLISILAGWKILLKKLIINLNNYLLKIKKHIQFLANSMLIYYYVNQKMIIK